MNRRQFTRNALTVSAVISVSPSIAGSGLSPNATFKKGIMWGTIGVGKTILEKFQAVKQAGFDGLELASHLNRQEVLEAREKTGLIISSVCGDLHWKYLLSDPDPAVREKGVEALKVTIEDAKAYSCDTALLVPGKVLENVSYDECWKRSTEEIKKALPLAEKLKVKIAIENVWNDFLLSPMEAANYVDQFRSPYVGFYFDCGNIRNYGYPEQWISILGKRIAKVHIKEFDLAKADASGKRAGFQAKLTEGSVNWPAVIKALKGIGYNEWLTLEQSGGSSPEGLKDLYDRLGRIMSM